MLGTGYLDTQTAALIKKLTRLSWLKCDLTLISWYQEAKEVNNILAKNFFYVHIGNNYKHTNIFFYLVVKVCQHHVHGLVHPKHLSDAEGQVLDQLHQRPEG